MYIFRVFRIVPVTFYGNCSSGVDKRFPFFPYALTVFPPSLSIPISLFCNENLLGRSLVVLCFVRGASTTLLQRLWDDLPLPSPT